MDDKAVAKRNSIKNLFETMEYGEISENLNEAIEWLKARENHLYAYIEHPGEAPTGEILEVKRANTDEILCNVYTLDGAAVDVLLTKIGGSKTKWIDVSPIERARLVYKLGTEIQGQEKLISQIEVVARGILVKDTQTKTLPLLTDYLQYYSGFSVKYYHENPSWKPAGLLVGILPDETSLALLGCLLGSSLAAGYNVVLQTGPRITLVASFIAELATRVGMPEGTIRLIPGNLNASTFFASNQVAVVTILDSLYNEKYIVSNHFSKKLLNFSSFGIPMIVFDSADIDSACQSAIDAVWGYQGMTSWSVKNIFIQENKFESFVQKLKKRIELVKIGPASKRNIDISYPIKENAIEILDKIVETAENHGIEAFSNSKSTSMFAPTLLIGGNIFNNNVIKLNSVEVPVVTLTAFRTISEAAALANNNMPGFGASVWTESASLANEIVKKLRVTNIWINSYGVFTPALPLSPFKCSGNGYFGGKEGFYELVGFGAFNLQNVTDTKSGEAMEKAVSEAKKAQVDWNKLSRFERTRKLNLLAQHINSDKKNLSSQNLPEQWLDDWVSSIYDYICDSFGESCSSSGCYNVTTTREPCGIIAIETQENIENHNKKLIIASIVEGNGTIIVNESQCATTFYNFVSKYLPKSVLTLVPLTCGAVKVSALHRELSAYFGEKISNVCSLPLKDTSKFKVAPSNWEGVCSKVTLAKSAWFNVGQSFI